MAAVIGDYIPEPARFHAMIANPPLQHHHHHPHSHPSHDQSPYSAPSRPRNSSSSSTPRPNRSSSGAAQISGSDSKPQAPSSSKEHCTTSDSATSRIPSPPPSSSPAAEANVSDDHANTESMASEMSTTTFAPSHASAASHPQPTQQPSPSSDFSIPSSITPATPRQTVVHVRDIAHVKELAQSELLANPSVNESAPQVKYDISSMPTNDVIEMVAALLTKITSTNDLQHDALQRNVTHQQQANQSSDSPGGLINPMTHSVLAFHGKNVPAITIMSYLSRIHKYCPTTFEVFLSLLVFFDRMTERVNELVTKSEEARKAMRSGSAQPQDAAMRDSTADPDESDSDLADDDEDDDDMGEEPRRVIRVPKEELTTANGPSTYFVVDSFNIHRLIIAGVTAASKFFSDVFYTNSRYAKVGGLPLPELNHLELQFLVLNDFRLSIPVEDLEAYATMLVEFYAREGKTQG